MTDGDLQKRSGAAGITAIAVTYVYFLLYAQFGFVSYLKLFFPDPLYTERAMGAMGAGGLMFSIAAAILLKYLSPRWLLGAAFTGCALSATSTLAMSTPEAFYAAAFFIGGFAGLLTVTLAAGLRMWLPSGGYGLRIGLGTGIAYLLCNIPAVFDADPQTQTVLSALICLPGLASVMRSRPDANVGTWRPTLSADEFRLGAFMSLVVMFLALVWLDSTVFATIQLNDHLRRHTWGDGGMKPVIGLVHFAAAVVAGWWIDRRAMRGLLAATIGLFVIAVFLLQADHPVSWASGPLYAWGISMYSTALVALPTLYPDAPGLVPVRWRAAILYAVAGWIGSGLGVGLAQHLHSIPFALLVIAGLLIGIGLLFPLTSGRRIVLRTYGLPAAALAAAALYYGAMGAERAPPAAEASVDRGRAVYREEGCMHCHSQYIRPHTPDVAVWGPYHPIDRTESPPFVGNRRQGPDLMNVGLRRSADWHRQHLIDPPSLAPGSRMPSYSHLFRDGSFDGESLVLYLASLGRAYAGERNAFIQSWQPDAGQPPIAERGREVFGRYCSMCHGAEGRADGTLSPLFARPAMTLAKDGFAYVPPGLDEAEEQAALARIVKFGLVGLNMPGHEYLPDQDVVDVAAYVRTLAGKGQGGP